MHIGVTGINYKTTPVEIRSKVAIGSSRANSALSLLNNYVDQAIILCTCNRTEIYTACGEQRSHKGVKEFFKCYSGLSEGKLSPFIFSFEDRNTVRHLFRVASGLDSMLLGEYEILGQLKRALEEAELNGFVEAPLLDLFRAAIRVGRQVRVETGLSRNALSVSSVAVELAIRMVGDITDKKLVVVGAGEAGSLVARTCSARGASHIVVVSRSPQKGEELAASLDGRWAQMENLVHELRDSDIVICCSGAPHTIVKYEMVKEVMGLRPRMPLVIIDIAVPCNVTPEVKNLENVCLFNIDELLCLCRHNYQQREAEVYNAERIVMGRVEQYMTHLNEMKVTPVISALINKTEAIRQEKLAKSLKKMPNLTDEERGQIEMMSRSITQNILHKPIEFLKSNHDNTDYVRIVEDLFALVEQK